MTAIEYTLEEISYSRKEDRRIMESVLKNWLVDPKALNFFSPESKYPFKFKKWVQMHYTKNKINTTTIVLKHNEWVIGHVSMKAKKERIELLHLFVDSKYRKKGLGSRLLKETERYTIDSKVELIIAKVQKKNMIIKKILERLGYRYKNSNQNLMIKKLE
ncbi:MAG: GNAT family N-acetyltransferase [Candidatus Neomarinimicrobiota bacterium]